MPSHTPSRDFPLRLDFDNDFSDCTCTTLSLSHHIDNLTVSQYAYQTDQDPQAVSLPECTMPYFLPQERARSHEYPAQSEHNANNSFTAAVMFPPVTVV